MYGRQSVSYSKVTAGLPVIRPQSTNDSLTVCLLQLEEPRQQASSVLNAGPNARVELAMKIESITNLIQLVPRVPTKQMIDEAWAEALGEDAVGVWKSMIETWERVSKAGGTRT